jgi:3-isopropylmalate/(R)-2-methylmalate dehydratase small subunit
MAKQKLQILRSRCVPLRLDNIDTDQIIPSRYLKTTDSEGMGDHLFHDWRYNEDGTPNTQFVLNNPNYGGCVLVAGKNFGCGSSREHAAWALAGYGFRAVISTSFADIHKQNELNNFVLPVVVTEEFLLELFSSIEKNPDMEVEINLLDKTITNLDTNHSLAFEINGYKRHCFLHGLDDIDFLIQSKEKIENWEKTNG